MATMKETVSANLDLTVTARWTGPDGFGDQENYTLEQLWEMSKQWSNDNHVILFNGLLTKGKSIVNKTEYSLRLSELKPFDPNVYNSSDSPPVS